MSLGPKRLLEGVSKKGAQGTKLFTENLAFSKKLLMIKGFCAWQLNCFCYFRKIAFLELTSYYLLATSSPGCFSLAGKAPWERG